MIYENYFSLQQRPFSIAPNPDFLYAHGQYHEALAVLEYGMLHRGGFILLTGEVGTGKTTLCKHLLKSIPSDTEVALILHPQLDRLELLQLICKEFNVTVEPSAKESELIASITEFLLAVYAQGGYSLLVIDEAQHLDTDVLELIRLLTNLETHSDKLLQIILLGQPELNQRLQRFELRQLNQRFTARFHLQPLTFSQLSKYVQHRLHVAGSERHLFSMPALLALKRLSKGIPRLINLLADRSLMGCYALNRPQVSLGMVLQAAKEVLPKAPSNFIKYSLLALLVIAISMFVVNDLMTVSNNQKVSELYASVQQTVITKITGDDSVSCIQADNCWQGLLPQSLIPYSQSDVFVLTQGRWQKRQAVTGADGLVLSRIQWLAPFNSTELIKPGNYHEGVTWARNILSKTDLNSEISEDFSSWQVIKPDVGDNTTPAFYDVLLVEQVKQFQKRHGLLVDGILGKQTLISLTLWQQKNSEAQ